LKEKAAQVAGWPFRFAEQSLVALRTFSGAHLWAFRESQRMFCDSCGTALQPNQTFCSGCGKEIRGGIHISYPRRGRVQEHIRLLGILWLALGAINIVGSLGLLFASQIVFRHGAFGPEGGPPIPGNLLHFVLITVGIFVLAKAAVELIAGMGLLRREPWARMLTLVLAFFSLFNIPFGTALGIYALWVLLPSESDQEYRAESKAA
jgi:predicted nucleic acid-binding Zn ribbon protein